MNKIYMYSKLKQIINYYKFALVKICYLQIPI